MLYREVHRELEERGASRRAIDLVLAALEGQAAVEGVLSGETPPTSGSVESETDEQVPSVYLRDVTVSGFRGIGPEVTLDVPPGPGLDCGDRSQWIRQVQLCRGIGGVANR